MEVYWSLSTTGEVNVYMDPYDSLWVRAVKGHEREKVFPGSGYRYKVCNLNDDSNDAIDLVEYHIDVLPQFQDIVDESGKKGKFEGCLIINMNLGERPVICLGQDEEIFKQYIFTKKISACPKRRGIWNYDIGLPVSMVWLQVPIKSSIYINH